jgi:hypothetical protein
MAKQEALLNVEQSEMGRQAELYTQMEDDISAKHDLLVKQREKVLEAMQKAGQQAFSFTDEYGFKHTFTVVEGLVKLRHSKREEE